MNNKYKIHTWYGVGMGMATASCISAYGFSLPENIRGFFFAIAYLIATGIFLVNVIKYKEETE